MDPVSVLPAVVCMLIATAVARILVSRQGPADEGGRFASIDGIRGFLALAVFIHHGSIWYYYARNGGWTLPPSRLYTQFGQTSVALFFMITAFLFVRKISMRRQTPIDWRTLYLHRFFRLFPLYLFATAIALLLTAIQSKGHLVESLPQLVQHSLRWVIFTTTGMPDVNKQDLKIITAGVAWSLHYELAFYFALPLLALPLRRPFPAFWVVFGAVGVALLSIFIPGGGIYFFAFAGGAIAVYVVQFERVRSLARTPIGSLAVVVGLLSTLLFDGAYHAVPLVILTVVFCIVACGNDVFGILVRPSVLFLGERAYSIYLLHPFVLFVAFRLIVSPERAAELSPVVHWALIAVLTGPLVLLCDFTFRNIERPGIQFAAYRSDSKQRQPARSLA